jgi:RNA polymerase sigma factor (sigma-70 family)
MSSVLRSHHDPSYEESDEHALVTRVRDGDTAAFRVLVEKYLDAVTRFAFYIMRSHDAADDIAQAVFVSMWEHRESLDPRRSIRSWLFRAARNRALNERKAAEVRDRYRSDVQADVSAGSLAGFEPSPEEFILDTATVQNALAQLSERRRLTLRLRLEDELTHAEIADVLDVSYEAAKRLVARALADLQKILVSR